MSDPAGLRASVLIANFNYGRFLGYAIDSALAQTWPDVQVVVVDDGSTDESRSLLDTYGDAIQTIFKITAARHLRNAASRCYRRCRHPARFRRYAGSHRDRKNHRLLRRSERGESALAIGDRRSQRISHRGKSVGKSFRPGACANTLSRSAPPAT